MRPHVVLSAIACITSLQQLTIGSWERSGHDSDADSDKCLASLQALKHLTGLQLSPLPGIAAASLPPLPALRVRAAAARRSVQPREHANIVRQTCRRGECGVAYDSPSSTVSVQDLSLVFMGDGTTESSAVPIAALDRLSQFCGLTRLTLEVLPTGRSDLVTARGYFKLTLISCKSGMQMQLRDGQHD